MGVAEVTKATTVVTGNITQSLYVQYSRCAMASLTALSYQDQRKTFLVIGVEQMQLILKLELCLFERFCRSHLVNTAT